ncbi:MAG: T9SS type A sorting domain-containing protein [Candidatus Kapabacteria bacterium]|nr:T9SS type A sorting domain-containing protein [Candidatus Kapabacteria bacterium]
MKLLQFLCMMLLCTAVTIAQPWKFTDENDKFYDEPIDSVSGRWTRVYRGNDTVFYATKTAVATTLNAVQIGQSNWYSTTNDPKRWSVRLSSDAGRTWTKVWEDTVTRKSGEALILSDVFYPSPSTVVIYGSIEKFIKIDSNFNPIFEGKPFILRTFDIGATWIFDTTFFTKRFPLSEGPVMMRHTQPNQGLLMTMTVTPTDTVPKLYRWNYYSVGSQLIDTLYPVPFPTFLKGRTIPEMTSGGPGPSRVYLFTTPNALDDPSSTPSGAYTSDQGLTWQPMAKRCFDVANKVTLIDVANTAGTLLMGGGEVFFDGGRGDIRNDEVLRVSTDGGVTQKELWRKRRAPFDAITHFAFADTRRGMFLIPRYRNYGTDSSGGAYYGNELMIYRTEDGGATWVREPWDRLYHVGSPGNDMASGISNIFFLRTDNGSRLRLLTNQRDVFSFEPIPTSSVSDEQGRHTMELAVAPNPASSSFLVDYRIMDGTEEVRLALYDAVGSLVFTTNGDGIAEGSVRIPVDSLSNGVYLLRVSSGLRTCSQKIMIAR